jgi:hypothetical protein
MGASQPEVIEKPKFKTTVMFLPEKKRGRSAVADAAP